MSENKTETAETRKASSDIASAAGIIQTVRHVLQDTAENHDALPPGSAGSIGLMLCVAMDMLPCRARADVKTSLGDVAHILGASFLEKTPVSPTITAALANIIKHAISEDNAPCIGRDLGFAPVRMYTPEVKPGTVDERGRRYVASILPPPDVAAAGIDRIEIWSEVPLSDEELAARREEAFKIARNSLENRKDLDGLRKETDSLTELVAKGGLKDERTRKQVLQRITDLIRKVGVLKKDVDCLPGGKPAPAERVPDWRDGAGTAEKVSGSTQAQEPKAKPEAKPEAKPAEKDVKSGEQGKHILLLKNGTVIGHGVIDKQFADKIPPKGMLAPVGHVKPATEARPASEPRKEKVSKGKPADGTEEVTGYFTQEEADDLTERIREWLSACNREHSLGDLMTTIEEVFKLSDPQLGELIGISSRLVCNVRHGRPSPSAKARFTEVFGFDGGVK